MTIMSPRGFKLTTPAGKAVKSLSKFLGAKPQPSDHAPPAGSSLLTAALPTDIIEGVLLYLPGRDILRMNRVRWDDGGAKIRPDDD